MQFKNNGSHFFIQAKLYNIKFKIQNQLSLIILIYFYMVNYNLTFLNKYCINSTSDTQYYR